jgi:hypothetical protein
MYIQSRADSDDINGMMAKVMIAMMMVLVMVSMVPEAPNHVDSVRQHSCKTFHNSLIFISQMNCEENSTTHNVCISQLHHSNVALLWSYEASSEGGY